MSSIAPPPSDPTPAGGAEQGETTSEPRGIPTPKRPLASVGRGLPFLARANYRLELTAAFFMPFVLSIFEGSVISVLVRIAYEGAVDQLLLNKVSALLAVVPAVANLSSFVWVRLSHGKEKIRVLTRLQLAMIACVMLIGLAPVNTTGLVLTVIACIAARTCWAGVTTIRSTIWKQNYPDGARAQITGRFAMVTTLMVALLALGLGSLMKWDDRAFRVLVPVGCVMGLVAVLFWKRVRVRGRRSLVEGELSTDARGGPSLNPWAMVRVLREDGRYAAFMTCQFLLGVGNITAMSLLAIILRETFDAGYLNSLMISTVITLAVMPLAIPLWARFLDGTHIVRFRSIHSWVFVLALGLFLVAARLELLWLMYVFALLKGIAFGGGVLAWTLGHLDFAPPEKASQYMGVHVTLTGVRGVVAWLGGVWSYEALNRLQEGSGSWAIAGCLLLSSAGALGFVLMSRHYAKRGLFERPNPPEPAPPTQVDR
ncbi:MAG: MFS transporter [Planctomycetota bacterium]